MRRIVSWTLFAAFILFAGRFDPYDILAYGVGVAACYLAERWWRPARQPLSLPS